MVNNTLIALAIGFIIYECIEHIVFPLVWYLRHRHKKSLCGVEGLMGKLAIVRYWDGSGGTVWVDGELWKAVCSSNLRSEDKVMIEGIEGLILKVNPLKRPQTSVQQP